MTWGNIWNRHWLLYYTHIYMYQYNFVLIINLHYLMFYLCMQYISMRMIKTCYIYICNKPSYVQPDLYTCLEVPQPGLIIHESKTSQTKQTVQPKGPTLRASAAALVPGAELGRLQADRWDRSTLPRPRSFREFLFKLFLPGFHRQAYIYIYMDFSKLLYT